MVSAFWHGFYPNYYIAFFFAFEAEQIASLVATKTKLFDFLDNCWASRGPLALIYIFFGMGANLYLNSLGSVFALTTFDLARAFMYNYRYVPYIIIILVHIILIALPSKKHKKDHKSEELSAKTEKTE